jgi:hypothetical protein
LASRKLSWRWKVSAKLRSNYFAHVFVLHVDRRYQTKVPRLSLLSTTLQLQCQSTSSKAAKAAKVKVVQAAKAAVVGMVGVVSLVGIRCQTRLK